ncbi:hypothetical protein ANANG_G00051280, partial [Anguilla anguilla]
MFPAVMVSELQGLKVGFGYRPLLLSLGYLNCLSLALHVWDRARWGSLARARLDTTLCSLRSLCLCLRLQLSSSSLAFVLCSRTLLLRETRPPAAQVWGGTSRGRMGGSEDG